MARDNQLEYSLKELFVDKAPALPRGGKQFIIQYAPWLSLLAGIVSLYGAWVVWHWAHAASALINYANTLSAVYGGGTVAAPGMTIGLWISVVVLAIEGVLYLLAFPGLRDRKKQGWNMLYYGLLLNIVYGIVVMFTSYGGVGNLIGAVIGAAIGLYLLFQVRSSYMSIATVDSTRPDSSKEEPSV